MTPIVLFKLSTYTEPHHYESSDEKEAVERCKVALPPLPVQEQNSRCKKRNKRKIFA